MYSLVLGGILGYLLGSIPTAFLLVRWKSKVDIRSSGSGNVGTLNSFQVTRSKLIGFLVLMVDLLKGFGAVWLLWLMFGSRFDVVAVGGILAVVGHNFPIWLRFKGGRGLATAAGVLLPSCALSVLVWGVLWTPAFLITRTVNVANTFALLALVIGFWATPDSILASAASPEVPPEEFRIFVSILLGVVLLKHVDPMVEYLRDKQ